MEYTAPRRTKSCLQANLTKKSEELGSRTCSASRQRVYNYLNWLPTSYPSLPPYPHTREGRFRRQESRRSRRCRLVSQMLRDAGGAVSDCWSLRVRACAHCTRFLRDLWTPDRRAGRCTAHDVPCAQSRPASEGRAHGDPGRELSLTARVPHRSGAQSSGADSRNQRLRFPAQLLLRRAPSIRRVAFAALAEPAGTPRYQLRPERRC